MGKNPKKSHQLNKCRIIGASQSWLHQKGCKDWDAIQWTPTSLEIMVLVEEILHHLGCQKSKNHVNSEINYLSTGARFLNHQQYHGHSTGRVKVGYLLWFFFFCQVPTTPQKHGKSIHTIIFVSLFLGGRGSKYLNFLRLHLESLEFWNKHLPGTNTQQQNNTQKTLRP